jgi:hypothetical protein
MDRDSLLLVLGPAEQFTPQAQRFLFQLRALRSFGNGALERFDQLGDSREDRAFVGGECGVTILQPAFDRLIWHSAGFVPRALRPRRRETRHPPSETVTESVRITALYSRGDRIVRHPGALARDPGARNVEVRGSHVGLTGNPEVYRLLGSLLHTPQPS